MCPQNPPPVRLGMPNTLYCLKEYKKTSSTTKNQIDDEINDFLELDKIIQSNDFMSNCSIFG